MKKILLLFTSIISLSLHAQVNSHSCDLTGTNDYVNAGNSSMLEFDTEISILLWLKPTSLPTSNLWECILNKESEYEIGISQSGELLYALATSTPSWSEVYTGIYPNLNSWSFIGITYDADSVKCYLNENLIFQQATSGLIGDFDTNYDELWFGWRQRFELNFNDRDFNGLIDDISLWNYALDSNQIQYYMQCPPSGSETGLVGYWNFEEGTGTTSADQTSNNNNGTLINGPSWSTDVPAYNCAALGINETTISSSSIKLYPNPSNLSVTVQSEEISAGQISIVNIIGAEVYSASFLTNSIDIDLNQIGSKGTYFVKVLDNKGNIISVKKLIYQ